MKAPDKSADSLESLVAIELVTIEPKIKSTFRYVVFLVLTQQVCAAAVLTLLPFYIKEIGATAWHLGWIMALNALPAILASPMWGALSDQKGRRYVLITSALGSIVATIMTGIASTFALLLTSRLMAGMFTGTVSASYAYAEDVSFSADRARNLNLIASTTLVAKVAGPLLVSALVVYGLDFPLWTCVALLLVALGGSFFFLEDSPPRLELMAARSVPLGSGLLQFRKALKDKGVRASILLITFANFAFAQLQVTLALYLNSRFDYGAREVSGIMVLSASIALISNYALLPRLNRKAGELVVIWSSSVLLAIAFVLFAWSPSPFVFVMAVVLGSMTQSLIFPALFSYVSSTAPIERKGSVMGFAQSCNQIANVVALPLAGWLFVKVSREAPYYLGAAVFLLCFFIAGMALLQKRRASTE